jgi:hypothetical protein
MLQPAFKLTGCYGQPNSTCVKAVLHIENGFIFHTVIPFLFKCRNQGKYIYIGTTAQPQLAYKIISCSI